MNEAENNSSVDSRIGGPPPNIDNEMRFQEFNERYPERRESINLFQLVPQSSVEVQVRYEKQSSKWHFTRVANIVLALICIGGMAWLNFIFDKSSISAKQISEEISWLNTTMSWIIWYNLSILLMEAVLINSSISIFSGFYLFLQLFFNLSTVVGLTY